MSATEDFQNKLQVEVDKFKLVQKEYQKAMTLRQQLDSQLNENTAVKQELDLVKSDAEVFKMIGPVLIKQDLEESRQNVAKRMDYIRNELKRTDTLIDSLDKKQDEHREALGKMQQQFQLQQAMSAAKV